MKARIKYRPQRASGGRESWARTVDELVDGVRGARGFSGEYLEPGVETDLETGQLVIEVYPEGSAKNGRQVARFLRVADGDLDDIADSPSFDWRADYLSCVDEARRLLAEGYATEAASQAEEIDLSSVPTAALEAELARRMPFKVLP